MHSVCMVDVSLPIPEMRIVQPRSIGKSSIFIKARNHLHLRKHVNGQLMGSLQHRPARRHAYAALKHKAFMLVCLWVCKVGGLENWIWKKQGNNICLTMQLASAARVVGAISWWIYMQVLSK